MLKAGGNVVGGVEEFVSAGGNVRKADSTTVRL